MPRRDRRRDMARRRRMRDMRSRRDRRYDMGYYDGNYDSEHYSRYDSTMYPEHDYARMGRRSQSSREYDRHYEYPYYVMENDYTRMGRRDYRGRDYNRYGYDYESGEDYLSDEELMDWSRELLKDVEEKDKSFLTRENIIRRAKEMGIKFDDFTEDELVVATLMVYTDYSKTLGTGNMDLYIRLAKDWLCDEDAEVQYGEKLAVYHDEIVMGD